MKKLLSSVLFVFLFVGCGSDTSYTPEPKQPPKSGSQVMTESHRRAVVDGWLSKVPTALMPMLSRGN